MFKVIQTTTAENSCTITAISSNYYITAMGYEENSNIDYIKLKTLEFMKYLISEDLLTKVKALLGSTKVNVVIQCHEKNGIINKLNNLEKMDQKTENKRNPRKCFYDVCYKGTSPITDVEYTNQVLIPSDFQLIEEEIKQMIWEKFQLTSISLVIREIQKEEFDIIKEDVYLLDEY